MSPVRDFLERFRPAGTPGKAAAAAVPADRARDLAAELEPVFSMFAGAEAERERILSEADRDARDIRASARRRAEDIVADARERAQAVRAEAAAAALGRAESEADAALRAAQRDASVIRERAVQLMGSYVSRAVAAVRMLADGSGGAGEEGRAGAAGGPPT